jgi:hypothetical protein
LLAMVYFSDLLKCAIFPVAIGMVAHLFKYL